jgi:type II secretory pathway component GspD/PulD (secretin)
MHFSRSRAAVIFSALLGLQLSAMQGSALAATEVREQSGGIQLNATNATIKEVLDALATSYKLTYRIPSGLRDDLTVRCSGTLRQILEHALDGHDYILKVSDDSIEVVVLEASGTAIVASSGPDGAAPATGPVLPEPKPVLSLANYLHQEPTATP